ncbi:MAG: Crp/Fnr family transcriptional regulator [Fretibacterium sp.]|nr:Crp/Fnr family transcriptional regulator [Fretibacterium sp.]
MTPRDTPSLQSRVLDNLTAEQTAALARSGLMLTRNCRRGERVFNPEDKPGNIFVLISGKILIARDTPDGKRLIITAITAPGEIFGEVYAFMDLPHFDMYAEATEDCAVTSLDMRRLMKMKSREYAEICEVIQTNLLAVFARKTYNMNRRVRVMGGGTLRGKIARYLVDRQGKNELIQVPSRENMADYLGVARPSLSREISRMERDGLLEAAGRLIRIKDQKALEEYL